MPRSVGNPAIDIISDINPSTTLFQKFGVLRGETPKLIFAYFCSVTKVGPRRVGTLLYRQDRRQQQAAPGHEIPP